MATTTSNDLVKQVSVYDGSEWKINDIGVDAKNVSLQTAVAGETNLNGALSKLAGPNAFGQNKVVVTNSNGQLTTSTVDVNKINLNLVNGSALGSLRGVSTVKELPGVNDYTIGQYAFAEGFSTQASGRASHAEGYLTIASENSSHAEGFSTQANGSYSHAEGSSTIASGSISHAEGVDAIASGNYSHAEGTNTEASGYGSHAEGYYTVASGKYSHAEGGDNLSPSYSRDSIRYSDYNIFLQGAPRVPHSTTNNAYTLTSDDLSINWELLQIGDKIQLIENSKFIGYISSISSHSDGSVLITVFELEDTDSSIFTTPTPCLIIDLIRTVAHGSYSHAEGNKTKSFSTSSHSEGSYTTASGKYSHAEGLYTTASGDDSHAEGFHTIASEHSSHAEGFYTTASGIYSHAEGYRTSASGYCSHAEGRDTIANDYYSHAQNQGTLATFQCQTVIGRYNKATVSGSGTDEDPYTYNNASIGNYAFIIGNGTENTTAGRSNALEVDWSGNVSITGTLTQSSDKNLKLHISYLNDDAVDFIKQLKPAYYTKDELKHVGFYAQDIEEIDKWNCMVGEMNGYKTLSYIELIAPLVKYCQSLEKRIEELENKK